MIRQLLALVALITGLAAVAQPAQARYADIQAVSQAVQRDASCKQRVVATRPAVGHAWERTDPRICPRPQIVIIVPPVMLQADRARE